MILIAPAILLQMASKRKSPPTKLHAPVSLANRDESEFNISNNNNGSVNGSGRNSVDSAHLVSSGSDQMLAAERTVKSRIGGDSVTICLG